MSACLTTVGCLVSLFRLVMRRIFTERRSRACGWFSNALRGHEGGVRQKEWQREDVFSGT